MKFTAAVYMIVTSLCASLCCPEDDDYSDLTFQEIVNNEIIEVKDNKTNYTVGDTIFITSNVKNKQTTISGEEIFLSDYIVSGEFPSLIQYQLKLFKETAFNTDVDIPLLPKDIIMVEGTVQSFGDDGISTLMIDSFFNGEDFKSQFGLILKEPGNFYIADAFRKDTTVELYGRDFKEISPIIRSVIVNSDENGRFLFTVTP